VFGSLLMVDDVSDGSPTSGGIPTLMARLSSAAHDLLLIFGIGLVIVAGLRAVGLVRTV
jgi:hypothetical protein